MKKKVISALLIAAMTASMVVGCGSTSDDQKTDDTTKDTTKDDTSKDDTSKDDASKDESQDPVQNLIDATEGTVKLTVWCSEMENWQNTMKTLVEDFKATYPDVTFDITIGAVSEADCKDRILEDVEAAADVFVYADDQITELVKAGALQEIATTYTYDVKEANGEGAVGAASADGKLYGYPLVASNGYFLFYDKNVFSEEDVASWEGLIAKAQEKGVQVGMNAADGWYLYGFFGGAGCNLSLNDDGSNNCDWNSATGVAVANSVMELYKSDAMVSINDADSRAQYAEKLKAYVNGLWALEDIVKGYGEDYGAVKIPTFKVDGKDTQVGSYSGYKLVGVNAHSKSTGWAMIFSEFISNEASQAKIADATGEGVANSKVAAEHSSPALAALVAQSEFADAQRVGGNYWDPAASLGQSLVEGKVTDMQKLLDDAVAGITQPVS